MVDQCYKIVLIGDSNVGKTNLLSRYITGSFESSQATIGVAYRSKLITIDGKVIRLEVWDTAGEDRFQSIIPSYNRNAIGAIVVYDISNNNSFINLTRWIEELKKFASANVQITIAANKSDLNPTVSTESAQQFALNNGWEFAEVSALDGTNVDSLFDNLAGRIYHQTVTDDKSEGGTSVEETVEIEHCCFCC